MGNNNVKPHPKPRNKKQLRWKAADRPSPPGKPSLVQENGLIPDLIHIRWQKPQKDGGSTIIAYMVEHKKLGSPHWIKASQLPILNNELIVDGLEPGWRYQFRVFAENAVGHSDPSEISEPFTVSLQRSAITAPKFTKELQDAIVLENTKVEFEVHFLGQPTPNICWFKDGFEIFSSNRIRIITTNDKSTLTFIQSIASDEGEIKCTATNRAGHTSTRTKLTIEAPPCILLPRSYQDQDGIIFEIGETIRLDATVGGRPTPLIFWSHNGESIQNDERHEIEFIDKIATVNIENALRSDRGEYQIRAVNKLGEDQVSFLVTITDKPTPPGKAKVLLTSGRSVTLSWSTPNDDGGCKIGNYIIEYYRVGWNVWLKAATSRQLTTMLGDLIEGSQYKFRVKAESPYGVSDPSEESEVVFIADHKRGIHDPLDIKKRNEQSPLPLEPPRGRRANSSPRVSFALHEDTPVRPERKKTGKTPEASPRLRRKKLGSPMSNSENSYFIGFDDISTTTAQQFIPIARKSSPILKKEKSASPTVEKLQFYVQENSDYPSINAHKVKTPSPEIIITDETTIVEDQNNHSTEKSPKSSPNSRKRDRSDKLPNAADRFFETMSDLVPEKSRDQKHEGLRSQNSDERIRPPLTHQNFSGSSEFMLVLCPDADQGTKFKKFDISFEENAIPPPLSLSAPELGFEPNFFPVLRRSASSTELLNFRLMERLNEASFDDDARETSREQIDRRVSLDIPSIQVNSKPTEDLAGLEQQLSLNRRLSSGAILHPQSSWSQRRHSLKNTNQLSNSNLSTKLHKFSGTFDVRDKQITKWTNNTSETANLKSVVSENNNHSYKEVISSEEETDSSSEVQKNESKPPIKYQYEEEDVTYNPRRGMLNATKADSEKPFEILTVRKEPPDSSMIPKPILKKKTQPEIEISNSLSNFSRNRSRSLISSVDDPDVASILKIRANEAKIGRNRSNSLVATYDESPDTPEMKSPNKKRNLFGLIPSKFNGDQTKRKTVKIQPVKLLNKSNNISALATSTSIAGAGVIIPDRATENKETAEEAKVVVDFYGDIVKSFGGKAKPTAEFSKSVIPKYDTYEERSISEIKTSRESDSQIKQTNTEAFSRETGRESPLPPTNISTTPSFTKLDYSPQISTQKTQPHRTESNRENLRSRMLYSKMEDSFIPSRDKDNIRSDHSNTSVSLFRNDQSENHRFNKMERSSSPLNQYDRNKFSQPSPTSRPHSKSSSSVKRRKTPRSRDASTSPVRFENWDGKFSSRNSLERDYYNTGSLPSSRASSLSRRSISPHRPKLREITTQTSFRIDPKNPVDILKEKEIATKAEKRVKGFFEYFTDLAMISVACWLYLFKNEYYAVPILIILVYRQVNDQIRNWSEAIKKRLPNWLMKRLYHKNSTN